MHDIMFEATFVIFVIFVFRKHVLNGLGGAATRRTMTPNRKNSKTFVIMSPFLYFCTRERKNIASLGKYNPYALAHHPHAHIGSLHANTLALQDYPKILSAINRAGKSSPAIR